MIFGLTLLFAHTGGQIAVGTYSLDPVLLRKAETRLEQRISAGELAGVVTLAGINGKTVSVRAMGFADRKSRTRMTPSTLFQVWSMTKPVTATAVMIAVEDGLLNLDDPVEKFLPQFKNIRVADGEMAQRRPTIRHLLTHTSGLSGDDPGGMTDEAKAKMSLTEYSKLIGKEPLMSHPGSAIRYSGVGINVAAAIVEKVARTPFDRFVEQRIFEPLRMKNTYFFLPRNRTQDLATTYTESDNGGLTEFVHDAFRTGAKFANGAGGLYSTAEDMSKFLNSFQRNSDHSLLSKASVDLMTTLQTGNLLSDGGDERGYGLGWSVIRSQGGRQQLKSIGTFGHTGAFGTEYWCDPKTGVSVVFLVQGFGLSDAPRKSFSTMVNASIKTRSTNSKK